MADVLIVCVREDEPQAKALAEMFEAAGFSIGGAPSSDAALRASGAGVIVWSQASIRSRPFLDAAQRVINADKAVVASLIEPPPPSSVGDAPAFDLSDWNGDPNDSNLDPLFFAVDRMVNSQRTVVNAPAASEIEEPPSRAAPRREPSPQRPQSYAPPPQRDALGSEAEHWRSIRDSRNPADFMDYLARFGPDGSFAEVAELRLKQLTDRPAPTPRREPPPPPSRPRMEARREPLPPSRREPPPQLRRAEAPPVRREPAPSSPKRMNFDRPPPTYDRNDLHEPPKQEGGAMRAFVLIAILGAIALGGGLYFGGNLNDNSSKGQQREASNAAPTTDNLAGAAPDSAGTPLSEAATTSSPPAPTRDAARHDTAQRNTDTVTQTSSPPPRPPQQQPSRQATAIPSSPSQNSSAGPVSLSGPELASNSASSGPVPLAPSLLPQAPAPTPASAQTTSAIPPRPTPGVVRFTQRPTTRRIAELYPDRALQNGVGGRVEMDCAVMPSLALNCSVASETPAGQGFAHAALSAAQSYRVSPTLSDGTSAVGTRTRVAVQFQAPTR
jgi:protein TonB